MAEIIDTENEPEAALSRACAVLADGLPVAIPTETVYGLAADATNPQAIARIYEMKGRPRFNPLICHVSDFEMADEHVEFDPLSRWLAEAFWPGPLTLILPLKPDSTVHAIWPPPASIRWACACPTDFRAASLPASANHWQRQAPTRRARSARPRPPMWRPISATGSR